MVSQGHLVPLHPILLPALRQGQFLNSEMGWQSANLSTLCPHSIGVTNTVRVTDSISDWGRHLSVILGYS